MLLTPTSSAQIGAGSPTVASGLSVSQTVSPRTLDNITPAFTLAAGPRVAISR